MRNRHFFLVALAASGLLAATASATITGISFSGPGGTGIDGLTGGNLTEPRLDYSSLNYIDLSITVDSAGTYTINEAPGFGDVVNHTGLDWGGLDLNVQSAFGTLNADWSDGGSPFATVNQSPSDVTFSNGSAADGTHVDPFGTFAAPGAGTFILRETPLAVPEPASFVAGALGMLGAIFLRSRRRPTT